MSRFVTASLLVAILAPSVAGADYLYDAFREECGDAQVDHYYTAADPVIGTVPLVKSEVGRVGNNFLVYGGFRFQSTNDLRGHLYAIRLFEEDGEGSDNWKFTDTSASDLLSKSSCDKGMSGGSACLFDAGQRLRDRPGTKPRRIYTGLANDYTETLRTDDGAFTVPLSQAVELPRDTTAALAQAWSKYVALQPISDAMPVYNAAANKWLNCARLPSATPKSLCDESVTSAYSLANPSEAQLKNMVNWLHGVGKNWPLGDIYHSSAVVVGSPGFEYRDRGYPEFRKTAKDRPAMIYVGANDGMIHAFHASPDLDNPTSPRWEMGDEAWAYLPMSMLARTMWATATSGTQRFFSQDLSCRYTDVQVDRSYTTCPSNESDRADKYCGWRTVLLCGQGWGGSWYLALDVTEAGPYAAPKPLWEFTHLDPNNKGYGLGRTWSLPSISLAAIEEDGKKQPFWLAIFGNGYNTQLQGYVGNKTITPFKPSYRALNLPLDGDYPQHGKGTEGDPGHAYVLDISNGKLLFQKHEAGSRKPIVADSTVMDFDQDGIVDVGYLAGFDGMNRLFIGSSPSSFEMCDLPADSSGTFLAAHPTVFNLSKSKETTHRVLLVTGGGIDSGHTPDEQANNGNNWSIVATFYDEKKVETCPSKVAFGCNLVVDALNDGSRKARLLGAPILSEQPNGDVWLIYTVWTAPHHNKLCDSKEDQATGIAYMVCMDVTLKDNNQPRCAPCDIEGGDDGMVELYRNKIQPPASPVSVDGMVYLTDPDKGLQVVSVSDSEGGGPNANSSRSQTEVPARLISWREVYATE